MKWVFFFCSQDTVYKDIVHYLTLYIIITNQYINFFLLQI
jgi:hypothetical protein